MSRAVSVLVLGLAAAPLGAQQVTGFTPANAAREDSLERLLLASPDTASARQFTHDLTVRPHLAGTPAQAVTRDYVLAQLKAWGMDSVWSQAYDVFIPEPELVDAWVLAK